MLALAPVLALPIYGDEFVLTDDVGVDDSSVGTFGDSQDFFDESNIDLISFQQPGTARPPTASRRPTRRPVAGQETATPTAADVGDYLASAPRMFGHYYGTIGQLLQRGPNINGVSGQVLLTDIPMGGGAGPFQIADNNSPLPQDRFFLNYNYFDNALRTQSGGSQIVQGVDQYTVGFERTFLDGITSCQLQLPVTGGFDTPSGISAGRFGNLGFISKTAIWRSDYAILSAGLGLDLPTGSSVQSQGRTGGFQIRNSSTSVLPYLGIMALPTDATFFQTFVTASLPVSGNQFEVTAFPGAPVQTAGVFTPQSRLHLDLAAGTWLYQNPGGGGVTGMAFVGEVHYVAAMQSGDFINFTSSGQLGPSFFQLGNLSNQQTVTNFTLGIHTTWNDRFQFRIGGAFPLARRPNRGFDGEVIAQINFIP